MPAAKVGSSDGNAGTTGALPPSAVFRIDPAMSGASLADAASRAGADAKKGQLPPAVSPMMADYLAHKDLPGLMAKVSRLPNDAEALFCAPKSLRRAPCDPINRPVHRPEKRPLSGVWNF